MSSTQGINAPRAGCLRMSVLLYYVNAAPPSPYQHTRYAILVPQCGMLQCGPVPLVMKSAHVCGSGTFGQGVGNANDDPFDEYLKDPENPSIRVQRLTLRNQDSTREQCIQFVNLAQKNYRSRAGFHIYAVSIKLFCGKRSCERIDELAKLNTDSEWLNGNKDCAKTARNLYDINEYKLKTALEEFDGNTEPVRGQLLNMLEWFMDFFDESKKWKSEPVEGVFGMEDQIRYWHRYFHVLKNLAFGFGFSELYFKYFELGRLPVLSQP